MSPIDKIALLSGKLDAARHAKLAGWIERLRYAGSQRTRLVELLVFAALLPLAGFAVFAGDPFGLQSGFPWVIAGPILFAARYGSTWGTACSLLAAAIFLGLPVAAYESLGSSLLGLSVGTIVMSVVVGDMASMWRRRSTQSDAENQYLRHRLKEFSSDYHVLKVSHGQLEEFMAGQRLSLREALQQLKPVLSSSDDGLEAGAELMAIFAQFCSVQVAGLYAMKSDTLVDTQAVATHGQMGELPVFDPLLRLAVKERQLVSVKLESLAQDSQQSSLLAVVPIVDSHNNLHGILAIQDMHFMAFQQENLNILALLGGYIGNLLNRSKGQSSSRTAWFLSELDTAIRFARTHSVQSSLLCLQLDDNPATQSIAAYLSENVRSLDSSWIPPTRNGSCVLVLLLPLLNSEQCAAYVNRAVSMVRDEFGVNLGDITQDAAVKQLSASDSRQSCLDFINRSTGMAGRTDGERIVNSATPSDAGDDAAPSANDQRHDSTGYEGAA